MSTKALRALVDTAEAAAKHHPLRDEAIAVIAEARSELEAMEKAAVEWVVSDHGELSQPATDVLCAISNEVILRKGEP